MTRRDHRRTRTAVALVAALLIALDGCASGPKLADASLAGETIRVLGSWTDQELANFRAVLAPFEQRTGARVAYTATRDLTGLLRQEIAAGTPPDITGIDGPGAMAELARAGTLKDLSGAIDIGAYKASTAPTFVDLGTVEGRLVGVFIRSSVKGLIWYARGLLGSVMPHTWDQLLELAARSGSLADRTWCVGLASEQSSGWPGTDWIEDFLLRQSGATAYDAWVGGKLAWSSSEVRRAFEAYGAVVAETSVYGGANGAITTRFGDAGTPMFGTPPGCLFTHQGSFIQAFFEAMGEKPTTDFDFFPFPTIEAANEGSVIGGGDLVGLVNDRPAARELIRYLVGKEAQALWVSKGGTLSVNGEVTDYPDAVSARAAEMLRSATRFRFDASDLMPKAMSDAFLSAVLAFTFDQRDLTAILARLDKVRATAYAN